jgi:excisionase family DNA binding protein
MKKTIKTLSTQEIAEHFGVHPATIRIWAKAGKIKEINLGYRTKRYELHNLI